MAEQKLTIPPDSRKYLIGGQTPANGAKLRITAHAAPGSKEGTTKSPCSSTCVIHKQYLSKSRLLQFSAVSVESAVRSFAFARRRQGLPLLYRPLMRGARIIRLNVQGCTRPKNRTPSFIDSSIHHPFCFSCNVIVDEVTAAIKIAPQHTGDRLSKPYRV